jgi:hypothetical protein
MKDNFIVFSSAFIGADACFGSARKRRRLHPDVDLYSGLICL